MRIINYLNKSLFIALLGTALSCSVNLDPTATQGEDEEEEQEESGVSKVSEDKNSNERVFVDNLSQRPDNLASLGLSKLLIIDGLEEAGNNLRLAAEGEKSAEACHVTEFYDQAMKMSLFAAQIICHLEIESDKIEFGKKYYVRTPEEEINDEGEAEVRDGWVGVFADDSVDNKLRVTICEGKDKKTLKPAQYLDITFGANPQIKTRGAFHEKEEFDGKTYEMSNLFGSKYTINKEGGINVVLHNHGKFDKQEFKMYADIVNLEKLIDLKLGVHDKSEEGEFSASLAAKYDFKHGSALAYFNDDGEKFATVSHFDNELFAVKPDSSDKFAEGGPLFIPPSSVPKSIASIDIVDISAGGGEWWDCKDAEDEIELNVEENAKHQQCNFTDDHGDEGDHDEGPHDGGPDGEYCAQGDEYCDSGNNGEPCDANDENCFNDQYNECGPDGCPDGQGPECGPDGCSGEHEGGDHEGGRCGGDGYTEGKEVDFIENDQRQNGKGID